MKDVCRTMFDSSNRGQHRDTNKRKQWTNERTNVKRLQCSLCCNIYSMDNINNIKSTTMPLDNFRRQYSMFCFGIFSTRTSKRETKQKQKEIGWREKKCLPKLQCTWINYTFIKVGWLSWWSEHCQKASVRPLKFRHLFFLSRFSNYEKDDNFGRWITSFCDDKNQWNVYKNISLHFRSFSYRQKTKKKKLFRIKMNWIASRKHYVFNGNIVTMVRFSMFLRSRTPRCRPNDEWHVLEYPQRCRGNEKQKKRNSHKWWKSQVNSRTVVAGARVWVCDSLFLNLPSNHKHNDHVVVGSFNTKTIGFWSSTIWDAIWENEKKKIIVSFCLVPATRVSM